MTEYTVRILEMAWNASELQVRQMFFELALFQLKYLGQRRGGGEEEMQKDSVR